MPSTRRRFLGGAGLALAGIAATTGAASRPGRSADRGADRRADATVEWPLAGYDPAGTGTNPDATGPADGVEIAWSHDATDWFRGTAAPILADGTLFAVGEGLLALDPATGEKRFGTPGPYYSSPTVARATIYRTDTVATTGAGGVVGLNASGGVEVPILDRQFGGERWTQAGTTSSGPSLLGSLGPSFGKSVDPPTPVTAAGTIVSPLSGTTTLLALDPDDGEVRWRHTHPADSPPSGTYNRPAIAEGVVYATAWPYVVDAFDVETGERRWGRKLDEQMVMAPIATDEGILVQTRNGVRLLDREDGSRLWIRDLDSNVTESTPAVADGRIYAASQQESLYALDLATGETVWSRPFQGPSRPVVADGVVYAVRSQHELLGFDAATGKRLFSYEPSQVPLSPPIVGDGVLYAVNRERVLALREAP